MKLDGLAAFLAVSVLALFGCAASLDPTVQPAEQLPPKTYKAYRYKSDLWSAECRYRVGVYTETYIPEVNLFAHRMRDDAVWIATPDANRALPHKTAEGWQPPPGKWDLEEIEIPAADVIRLVRLRELKEAHDSLSSELAQNSEFCALLPAVVEPAPEQYFLATDFDVADEKSIPPLDGVVVSVKDNMVVLSISTDASRGVKVGDSLTVYRGSNYIATVQVTHVIEDMAAAQILRPEGARIQNGDLATTRIY